HGNADLLEHELAVALVLRRSQALGAAGNADGIVVVELQALHQLPEHHFEAVIETPHDGGVALISFPRRLEMEELLHGNNDQWSTLKMKSGCLRQAKAYRGFARTRADQKETPADACFICVDQR